MISELLYFFSISLASGVMATQLVIRPNDLEPKFFRVNGIIAAVLSLIAVLLDPQKGLTLTAVMLGLSILYSTTVLWIPIGFERLILVLITLLGAWKLQSVSLVLGGLTMGAALVAMNVGHWYLSATKLSMRPLKSTTLFLISLLVLRLLYLSYFAAFRFSDLSSIFQMDQMIWMVTAMVRVLFGAVGPIIMAWMTWQTVKIQSTQSATGILYALLSLSLVGEACGIYLFRFGPVAL